MCAGMRPLPGACTEGLWTLCPMILLPEALTCNNPSSCCSSGLTRSLKQTTCIRCPVPLIAHVNFCKCRNCWVPLQGACKHRLFVSVGLSVFLTHERLLSHTTAFCFSKTPGCEWCGVNPPEVSHSQAVNTTQMVQSTCRCWGLADVFGNRLRRVQCAGYAFVELLQVLQPADLCTHWGWG